MKKNIMYMTIIVGAVIIYTGFITGVTREGYMSKIENLANNTIFEEYIRPLFTIAYMSATGGSPIDHATVGLELGKIFVDEDGTPGTGDEFYANVVDQCVFHSNESFDPLCVICRLSDKDGNVVAAGIKGETFDEAYVGSTTIFIDVEPDPENFLSNEVMSVHDVELHICAPPDAEGCTPGYWRQEQHFGSWAGFSPVDLMTPFRDAFMLGDTDIGGNAIIISMKSNGGGGKATQLVDDPDDPGSDVITLLDAIWAQGGNENKMGRHATASLLNAANPDVTFDPVLTELEIKRLVQIVYGTIPDDGIVSQSDFNQIGDVFATSNDLGDDTCPIGLNPLLPEAP